MKEEEERARGKRTSPGQAPWGKEHAWGGISTSMGVETWQWLITHAASRIYCLRIVRLGIVLARSNREIRSATRKVCQQKMFQRGVLRSDTRDQPSFVLSVNYSQCLGQGQRRERFPVRSFGNGCRERTTSLACVSRVLNISHS